VKIYNKSNELIRYFVACRNPSNVVGMYDLVNKVFYESSDTKPFVNNESNLYITNDELKFMTSDDLEFYVQKRRI
jgi:hypothetical protein